jgi:hypothetical protein
MAYWDPDPSGGWRPVQDVYKPFYTGDNPQAAYRQFGQDLAGGDQDPFARYVASQYGNTMANYLRASEANPKLQWGDYLSPGLMQHLHENFGLMSSAQQGQQWGSNVWAGRWVG